NSSLGKTAWEGEPMVRQLFLKRPLDCADEQAFNRKLYIINQRATSEIRRAGVDEYWYVSSLSTRTIIYKGMLMPVQVDRYFPELRDPAMESAIALVHSRFSTNTFPSWERCWWRSVSAPGLWRFPWQGRAARGSTGQPAPA